jgi:CBS domain-containing protein
MSVESQLLAEPIRSFDLNDYCMVTPSTTVRETVEQMRETKKHTAFIVGDHTVLQGILTDRDVMRKVATSPDVWDRPVTDLMTPEPFTLSMNATAGEALRQMDEKGFRNVPVVNDKGTPIGNLTYFSLVHYLSDHFQRVVLNAPPTTDFTQARDGG